MFGKQSNPSFNCTYLVVGLTSNGLDMIGYVTLTYFSQFVIIKDK